MRVVELARSKAARADTTGGVEPHKVPSNRSDSSQRFAIYRQISYHLTWAERYTRWIL